MAPHWPSPLVAWILVGWTAAVLIGVVILWRRDRPTRTERALEDAKVYRLPSRAGVNAMFDPGRETRP